MRVLEEAEILFCEDTRVAKKLLKLLQERHGLKSNIKRFISLHSHNEERVLSSLEPTIFEKNVVYMSDAGMPCVSDPGALLVEFCQKEGIEYTVLPGPSAFVTAYAASGFKEKEFLFYGFLPHKGKQRESELEKLLRYPFAVILYEAPHRIEKLLLELSSLAPDRTLFIAKEITKRHERYFKGVAKDLSEKITGALSKGEWVVVLSKGEEETEDKRLTQKEIEELDLSPKQKAKLLSKATGLGVKECYRILTSKMENGDKMTQK